MNRFLVGKARGVKGGPVDLEKGDIESSGARFRQKKVPRPIKIRITCEDVFEDDSTKNEDPAVEELSSTDESDESSVYTNDSQTFFTYSSFDDTLPSKEIHRSTSWMFGGGFEGTFNKFGDSMILGMDGVVPDTIGDGVMGFLNNATLWKSKAPKRNNEGKVVKPGNLLVYDSEDGTEFIEEGCEEDGGLEILLANDDESISSCQEKSGFRVKSKEFIEANEAEKGALEGEKKASEENETSAKIQRKWNRSLIAPTKDCIDANVAKQKNSEEEDAGTKHQRELDRNLVAPIKTQQSVAYPAPIFHSRSKFQDNDEDLNGPAIVKQINSGSSEKSFQTVVGKPNVVKIVQYSGESGMELSRIPSSIEEQDAPSDEESVSQDAPSEIETSGGRPRRVMSPMQNIEEDGVEVERVVSPIHYLDEVDKDTSSLPSPSRKSSRVKDTHGPTITPQRGQKELPGKRMPMKPPGGGHIPFNDLAKTSERDIEESSLCRIMKDYENEEKSKQGSSPSSALPLIITVADNLKSDNVEATKQSKKSFNIDSTQSTRLTSRHTFPEPKVSNRVSAFTPQEPEYIGDERKPGFPPASSFQEKARAAGAADKIILAKKQAAPFNTAIQSKQDSDNILQDLRHFTQTVSHTGISKVVPTHGPYGAAVPPPPPPPLPPTPATNDTRPRADFSEWEHEMFDFSQVKANAFSSTKQDQASAAPAIKPLTPKTNAFSSSKQIQAAAAPVSKATAPTTNASPSKIRPRASSASASKLLVAKTDAFPPAKTSATLASKPITPKTNVLTPKQHPDAVVAPVNKPMDIETHIFAAKKQRQVPVVSLSRPCPPKEKQLPPSQSRSISEGAPPPSLQVSRQTFTSKIQLQVSSTPVSKPFPRKATAPNQHPQAPVAPGSQSFSPKEKPLPPNMTKTRPTIAPQPKLQARQPLKVAQPVVEPSLAPTVDAGGWEDFENIFANDFKNAFANAPPKVRIATFVKEQ